MILNRVFLSEHGHFKVWKLIKIILIWNGIRRSERSAHMQYQERSNYRKDCQWQTPTEKIIRIEPPMAGLNIKGVHSISYNISTTPATQPIWNLHMLKLLIFSSERLFKTSHNFLFLHKITYLSSVELAYAFYLPGFWACCSSLQNNKLHHLLRPYVLSTGPIAYLYYHIWSSKWFDKIRVFIPILLMRKQ